MNKFLLVACIMGFVLSSQGQTRIDAGTVSGTWTKAGSPYNVYGDLTVPKDSVWTIEAGVRVRFQGEYGVKVDGKVLALGTGKEQIRFGAIDPNGNPWKGFLFYKNQDTSEFRNCYLEMSQAEAYINPKGQKEYVDGYLVFYAGIAMFNSSYIIVDSCDFNNNFYSIHSVKSKGKVTNSEFYGHGGPNGEMYNRCVWLFNSAFSIDSCTFRNNNINGSVQLLLSTGEFNMDSSQYNVISNSFFYDNRYCSPGVSGVANRFH